MGGGFVMDSDPFLAAGTLGGESNSFSSEEGRLHV
jgi:hypothetical protein